jgi:hypothetical protein
MNRSTPHPAEKHFDGIRGKKPAHHDHKQHGGHSETSHHEGGAAGFNMGEEGSVNETIPAPTEHGGSLTVPPSGGA